MTKTPSFAPMPSVAGLDYAEAAMLTRLRGKGKPTSKIPLPSSNSGYSAFLKSKIKLASNDGFEVAESEINPLLKPHQKDCVRWAIQGGRRAIFAAFGLGKTFMQIEIVRIVVEKLNAQPVEPFAQSSVCALVVLPLGVRQEFVRDAETLGDVATIAPHLSQMIYEFAGKQLGIKLAFIRTNDEFHAAYDSGARFFLSNYESIRDGKLNPDLFSVASLDEASCLRSSNSKTYHAFLELFANVAYRFVATATPSPNDFIELLNYAGFLGIAEKSQLRTRFFDRDSQQANNLKLRPNMREEFWSWVHSWALFLQKPSDLGHDNTGYDLPPLHVVYHEVGSGATVGKDIDGRGQAKLFRDAGASLPAAAAEKRESLPVRIQAMLEIIAQTEQEEPDAHFLLWHDLEAERHAIQASLPEAVSVWGTQDMDARESAIIGFSEGKFRFLSTKPEIAGSGCNFQRHCHHAIFTGIGYKFNDFIQAIHRIYRFQQTHECVVHILHTEAERPILASLKEKWRKHDETVAEMSKLIREFGLGTTGLHTALARRVVETRREVASRTYRAINGDTVPETAGLPDNHVDLICSSIPFGTQYEYTECFNDFGHNENNDGFFRQMDYLTPNLLRVLKPGRIAAIHVKDRVNFGNYSGYGFASVEPFHADCITHFRKHGFVYMGMIHIDTDVVKENNQTYRLGWTECCKDGTKMGVGMSEYILLFRKKPTETSDSYADLPVTREKATYTRARWQIDAHAHWKSSGARLLTPDEILELHPEALPRAWAIQQGEAPYSYWDHVELCEKLESRGKLSSNFMMMPPMSTAQADHIWSDVVRQLTLNGAQTQKGLQNHICPLQFDIVDRIIDRYSNPGELVFDPFAGLMTVPFRAVKWGRHGLGIELNPGYFDDGVKYLKAAEESASTPDLFVIGDAESTLERQAA